MEEKRYSALENDLDIEIPEKPKTPVHHTIRSEVAKSDTSVYECSLGERDDRHTCEHRTTIP